MSKKETQILRGLILLNVILFLFILSAPVQMLSASAPVPVDELLEQRADLLISDGFDSPVLEKFDEYLQTQGVEFINEVDVPASVIQAYDRESPQIIETNIQPTSSLPPTTNSVQWMAIHPDPSTYSNAHGVGIVFYVAQPKSSTSNLWVSGSFSRRSVSQTLRAGTATLLKVAASNTSRIYSLYDVLSSVSSSFSRTSFAELSQVYGSYQASYTASFAYASKVGAPSRLALISTKSNMRTIINMNIVNFTNSGVMVPGMYAVTKDTILSPNNYNNAGVALNWFMQNGTKDSFPPARAWVGDVAINTVDDITLGTVTSPNPGNMHQVY